MLGKVTQCVGHISANTSIMHTSSVVLTILSKELKYVSHRNCVCDLIESS